MGGDRGEGEKYFITLSLTPPSRGRESEIIAGLLIKKKGVIG